MTKPELRLPPAQSRAIDLDPSQHEVVERVRDGASLVVIGPPGSGKSATAVASVVAAIEAGTAPERVVLLAPTRAAAARLRDRVALAVGRPSGVPLVRTAASVAYSILVTQSESLGQPRPSLISGAEQDVVLRELLEGHAAGRGALVDWAGIVPDAATLLPSFREELRSLLMRAAEAGLQPDDLAELGRSTGRREWVASAEVYREYQGVMDLSALAGDQGWRYDPASVVADAADVLARWDELAEGAAPAWDLVVVDDFQDATAAVSRMLDAMRAGGARLLLCANADEAVQGYRGAVPSAAADAPERWGAERLELSARHRQDPRLSAVVDAVAARIGAIPWASARRVAPDGAAGAPVVLIEAPHRHAQSRAIAAQLRRARHGFGGDPPVAWSEMAVIARSGAALRELRADLMAADIPCESLGDAVALHQHPSVAPLLTLLRVALGQSWDEATVMDVLGSRLVGLDPVAQRRLRRALVRDEREAGGTRSSGELLLEAIESEDRWAGIATADARRAAVASRAVAAVRQRATADGATPGAVLWAAWAALGVAEAWRDAALAGSTRDDADLDAVIALFRAAQQFTERLPGAHALQFIDYLEAQEFAADSLASRAQRPDVVTFATPASAAGREWDVVVVAGLEEGAWPNPRLRDSVLGAGHLADILARRADRTPVTDASRVETAHGARRAVLDDETRAFVVAISRPRRLLIATCAPGEDSRASRYLWWLAEIAQTDVVDAHRSAGVSDLRDAVARLRIDGQRASGAARAAHATMLSRLAGVGIQGADPRHWHGVPEPSTADAFWDADATIRVSPSRVEAVETCALKWALETAGANRESSMAQEVGTLVHSIAAEHPRGSAQELLASLDERWHEVGARDTWAQRADYQRARAMVQKFAQYVARGGDGEVLVEQPFSAGFGRALLSGQADRVEIANGAAVVVDLKTGRAIPAAEAGDHAQLAMYQLAADHGAFRGVTAASGASLVFLGNSTAKSPTVLIQPPIDVGATRARLGEVVDTMGAASFVATVNATCDHCPVRRSCPAQATGRQVTDS